jgi:hypothetical protein
MLAWGVDGVLSVVGSVTCAREAIGSWYWLLLVASSVCWRWRLHLPTPATCLEVTLVQFYDPPKNLSHHFQTKILKFMTSGSLTCFGGGFLSFVWCYGVVGRDGVVLARSPIFIMHIILVPHIVPIPLAYFSNFLMIVLELFVSIVH